MDAWHVIEVWYLEKIPNAIDRFSRHVLEYAICFCIGWPLIIIGFIAAFIFKRLRAGWLWSQGR